MIWRPKRTKEELQAELGDDLVEWGENVEALFDELPPDDGTLKPDDEAPPPPAKPSAPPTPPVKRVTWEHRDRNGNLMNCIICGDRLTVDGRFCKRHYT